VTGRVTFTVLPEEAGKRADVVVAEHLPDISRSLVRSLIDAGRVHVNGRPIKASRRVAAGDQAEVEVVLPPSLSASPEPIPLTIVYQDADLAVIDKPAGLVVHPAAGHGGGTVANALAAMFPQTRQVGPADRPGIVHRLDKDTSGLMVVALSPAAQVSLQQQIASRTAERRYLALATGRLEPKEGTIEAPIGRDLRHRKRMAVHGVGARPARTSYRVLEYLDGFTLLEARLHTGRTHQIRVHLAAVGHPLAGDRSYHGAQLEGLDRQFLHAYRLALHSPSTGRSLEFESPLPPDLEGTLEQLR
jgi:23S rRNA pseudouridine1911/1915/1917 synthase